MIPNKLKGELTYEEEDDNAETHIELGPPGCHDFACNPLGLISVGEEGSGDDDSNDDDDDDHDIDDDRYSHQQMFGPWE